MFRLLVLAVLVCLWVCPSPASSSCSSPVDTLFYVIGRDLPPGTSSDFIQLLQENDATRKALMNESTLLTVLAFTDQEWSASGLKPFDPRPGYISSLISYHVINGILNTATLPSQSYVETLAMDTHGKGTYMGIFKQGPNNISLDYGTDSFNLFNGRAYINTQFPSISACNGVIYVIDRVLRPPHVLSESLTATLNSTEFIFASLKSIPPTYLDTLDGASQLTVFAPIDAAFAALPNLHSIDPTQWSSILQAHIVPNKVLFSVDLTVGQEIQTLAGTTLKVTQNGPQGLFINGVRVSEPNIITQNGVLHLIDAFFKSDVTTAQY